MNGYAGNTCLKPMFTFCIDMAVNMTRAGSTKKTVFLRFSLSVDMYTRAAVRNSNVGIGVFIMNATMK